MRPKRGKRNLKKGYGRLCQKLEIIYKFIQKHQHKYGVAKMSKVQGVSKSGYYVWLKRPVSKQKKSKAQLTAKIKHIHLQFRGIYVLIGTLFPPVMSKLKTTF